MYEDTEIADVIDRLDRARRERYLAEMQQAEQERETVRSEAYGAPDTSPVLQFLSYFDRPRNAIATAVKNIETGSSPARIPRIKTKKMFNLVY